MDYMKKGLIDAEPEKVGKWFMIESYFNTINHVLNGSVALYMTWLCFQAGWTITTWHALLLTIGYQLLMAEGIMALYSANSWSYFHSKDTKRLVHLIVLVGATILILVGNSIKIANTSSVKHFKSIHSITGLKQIVIKSMLHPLNNHLSI